MKPRIMHVAGEGFGGGSILVREMALAAISNGYDVDVLTTEPDFIDYLHDSGIGIVDIDLIRRPIRPGFDAVAVQRLRQILLRHRYHLVHTHTTKGGLIGRYAAWGAHVPVVLHTVHGFGFHERTPPTQLRAMAKIEQVAARRCHRIVTVSEFHRAWAIELGIANADKVVAIPNGINEDRVSTCLTPTEARERLGLEPEAKVVAACGRLAPQKGLEYLLRATESMSDISGLVVIIAGDGPLRQDLERQAALGRAAKTIRFLGFRTDVSNVLMAADLVVLPSLWEGLSISLLEAMAAGKPIVTTSIGSNREATKNGVAARVVPPANHEELARAIRELINNSEEASSLGARARARFKDAYSQESMLNSYMSLYQNPLGYAVD